MLGISRSYVRDLIYDPDGAKSHARKESYRGTCERCGASTNGSDGPGKAPKLCAVCAPRVRCLVWSASKIIAAIHEWDCLYGRPPVSTDWNKAVEGSRGGHVKKPRRDWTGYRRWPTLMAVQREFGSWADAIEIAGFPRPQIGHFQDESRRSEAMTKWTEEKILEWIKAHANGGKAPSSATKGAPANAAFRKFGSWNDAVVAAGYPPNRIVRSTR